MLFWECYSFLADLFILLEKPRLFSCKICFSVPFSHTFQYLHSQNNQRNPKNLQIVLISPTLSLRYNHSLLEIISTPFTHILLFHIILAYKCYSLMNFFWKILRILVIIYLCTDKQIFIKN